MLLLLLSLIAVRLVSAVGIEFEVLPKDLTTPHQQRLAIYGPNGMSAPLFTIQILTCVGYSCLCWLEYLHQPE